MIGIARRILDRRTETPDPAAQRLRAIARTSPAHAEAALLYGAILPLIRHADIGAGDLRLSADEARTKMDRGIPLLDGLDLEIDLHRLGELVHDLARAAESACRGPRLRLGSKYLGEVSIGARAIREQLEKGELDLARALSLTLSGRRNPGEANAQPGLVETLLRHALKPALTSWRRQLEPLVEGAPWHKALCFVCGTPAVVAELQGNDQEKHMRCAACGADWQVPRLRCVFCGNDDHRTQRILYAGSMRGTKYIEACDRCGTYMKVVAAFSPNSPEMLAVEDLSTLPLDYLAQANGYTRISNEQ